MILGKRGDFREAPNPKNPTIFPLPTNKNEDLETLLFFPKETWTISLESAAFLGETSHWDGTFPGFYLGFLLDFSIPLPSILGVGGKAQPHWRSPTKKNPLILGKLI